MTPLGTKIRLFRPADAAALAHIFHTSIHELASRDYTPEQVAAWSPSAPSSADFLTRVSDGRTVFVATSSNDTPIAFIELENNGHIDCFYCAPEAAGQGVGAALYQHLEYEARGRALAELSVEASETARRFFQQRGFQCEGRRDVERRGVWLHNYRMRKLL